MGAFGQSFSQDDRAVRESLLDIITNLDPTETQLVAGLGRGMKPKDILHNYPIDTLSAVKTNAYAQGSDASFQTLTDPTRLFNYVQTLRQPFMISDVERELDTAGFNDRYTYESTKAVKLIKNDLEFALMRGSIACGAASTSSASASKLRGVKNSLSLVTSQSGVSLSEKALNDYFQLVWDNSSTMVDAVYGSMYIKRKISGFTAGATKNVETTDRRLVNAVDVYQADAANMVKLFPHRYVTVAGDTNYDIVGISENFFKISYLREPFTREIARTGDATKGEVVLDATLEARHYNAGFWGKAHL